MALSARYIVVVVLLLLLVALPALLFAGSRLAGPSDGARLEPGAAVWRPDGVVITVLEERPGELREGDRVVAVAGRSLVDWSNALTLGAPAPSWRHGEVVLYTVVRDGQALDVPVTLGAYPAGAMLTRSWGVLVFVVVLLIGAFVVARRPADPAARLLLLWGLSAQHGIAWAMGLGVADFVGGPSLWLYGMTAVLGYLLFWTVTLHFTLVFPRPLPVLARWRWAPLLAHLTPFMVLGVYLATTRMTAASTLDWVSGWVPGVQIWAVLYALLCLAVVARQYQIGDATTRQQIRVVALASTVTLIGGLSAWFVPFLVLGEPFVSQSVFGLLLAPVPVALALAILRYRLFEIDIIINRALVYGSLTGLLLAIYLGSVVLLQSLFRTVTGQGNELAVIISTLTIAALFQPLRRRVQAGIDHRFYRRKYDAAQTLASFSGRLRDEVDLPALSEELVGVVRETMQPAHVSLWVRPPRPER